MKDDLYVRVRARSCQVVIFANNRKGLQGVTWGCLADPWCRDSGHVTTKQETARPVNVT